MKKLLFDIDKLRTFLEEKFNAPLKEFKLLKVGSKPENFLVVTSDDRRFFVKCSSYSGSLGLLTKYYLPHIADLSSFPKAVHLEAGPWEFGDCLVCVLSWCEGERILPSKLSSNQEADLIKTYTEFSKVIQSSKVVLPTWDFIKLRREVIATIGDKFSFGVKEFLEEYIKEEYLDFDKSRMGVIHGDFHHGNMNFQGDEVGAIFDFEDFRFGIPAEDWIRYIVCGAEHLSILRIGEKKRLLELFERLLPLASVEEWRFAIASYFVYRSNRALTRAYHIGGLMRVFHLWIRLPFFKALFKRLSEEACKNGDSQ